MDIGDVDFLELLLNALSHGHQGWCRVRGKVCPASRNWPGSGQKY